MTTTSTPLAPATNPLAPATEAPAPTTDLVAPTTAAPRRGRPMAPGGLPYEQALRTPARRWWASPLSLLIFVAVYLGLVVAILVAAGVTLAIMLAAGALPAIADLPTDTASLGSFAGDWAPLALLALNLMLVPMLPAVLIAQRATSGVRTGYTHSVTGRFRWGWCLRVTAWMVPLWLALLALTALLEHPTTGSPLPWGTRAALLGVILLTTPLQCAAEEYAFRGWLMQNVGAYFSSRVLAFAVPTAASIVLFCLAHGTTDFWLLLPLATVALVGCFLTSRTGGLEAAVAIHVVNNVVGMAVAAMIGANPGFIDEHATGSPVTLIQVAVTLLAGAVVLRLAARRGVQARTADAVA